MSSSSSQDQGVEEGSSGGQNRCRHPGCNKFFRRSRDLTRHETTHDPNSPKRRCPFLKPPCRFKAGEKQLSNWFEHIATIHGEYAYHCEECDKRWHSRKDLYPHKRTTGHSCLPKDRNLERQEIELEAKDQCYRRVRAELLRMRETGQGVWDDEWPETLPEYENFKRSKARKASPRRITPAAKDRISGATPSSSVSLPSNSTRRDTSGVDRRLHLKASRHHPYVRQPEFLTSVPTLDPLTPLGRPVSSPFAPGDLIPTSLEAHSPSLPERGLTQEEVDNLLEIAFSGGPLAWDIMAQIPTNSPVAASEAASEITVSRPCDTQGPDGFSEFNNFDDYFLMDSEYR